MQTYPPGTRIGQYEIASRPMMGGMGVVYFALDHGNDGRPVALKTFRPELLPDRAARDRFLREGTAWIELGSHPNIVRCYEVEYYDPIAFLSLELISKEHNMPDASLRSWLIPGYQMHLEQALLFTLQIVQGMQYATEKIPGFVHRDLKPENILIGIEKLPKGNINRLRVTDFGLAYIVNDEGAHFNQEQALDIHYQPQLTNHKAGTPLYMAPEQWLGRKIGIYSDVYALGCILYEMLTGNFAATGNNIAEIKNSHSNGELRLIPNELPESIKSILIKCLSLTPDSRYETWRDVYSALAIVYEDLAGQSPPESIKSETSNYNQHRQQEWSYNAMGIAYLDIGKIDKAEIYFERAAALANSIEDKYGEAIALGNIGIVKNDLGMHQLAIQYHERAIAICKATKNASGQAANLGGIANIYMDLENIPKAIDYYNQCLAIHQLIGDRRMEGYDLCNLGIAFMDVGDWEKAIHHLNQAHSIAREIKDPRGLSNALGSLGNLYLRSNTEQIAIQYYEECLRIHIGMGDLEKQAADYGNLGTAYGRMDKNEQAIKYIQESINIHREIGDKFGEALGNWNLGLAYKKLGKFQEAIFYMSACVDFERSINHPDAEKDAETVNGFRRQLGNVSDIKASAYELAASIEQAINAFINATSIDSMKNVVEMYPFMAENSFHETIAVILAMNEISPIEKILIAERLRWLKQLAKN